MIGREHFELAIIDSPDDLNLRLVYADWLEEHGDPRGEFIRVQCELAEMNHQKSLPKFYSEKTYGECHNFGTKALALHYREQELFKQEANCFFGQLSQSIVGQAFHWKCPRVENANWKFEFRRGFVESVSCRLADWVGGPCEQCGGTGVAFNVNVGSSNCPVCHGTGHINAFGPLLVRTAPIRELILTGLESVSTATYRFLAAEGMGTGPKLLSSLLLRWSRSRAKVGEYRKL